MLTGSLPLSVHLWTPVFLSWNAKIINVTRCHKIHWMESMFLIYNWFRKETSQLPSHFKPKKTLDFLWRWTGKDYIFNNSFYGISVIIMLKTITYSMYVIRTPTMYLIIKQVIWLWLENLFFCRSKNIVKHETENYTQ